VALPSVVQKLKKRAGLAAPDTGAVNVLLQPVTSILEITPLELARQLSILDQDHFSHVVPARDFGGKVLGAALAKATAYSEHVREREPLQAAFASECWCNRTQLTRLA